MAIYLIQTTLLPCTAVPDLDAPLGPLCCHCCAALRCRQSGLLPLLGLEDDGRPQRRAGFVRREMQAASAFLGAEAGGRRPPADRQLHDADMRDC